MKLLTLDNSLRIIFDKTDSVRSATIGVWVAAGSRYEGEKEKGMSHFTIGGKIKEKGIIDVVYFGGGLAANVVTPKCTLIVNNESKKVNFVEDFLKKDQPSAGQVRRYSFDMRA